MTEVRKKATPRTLPGMKTGSLKITYVTPDGRRFAKHPDHGMHTLDGDTWTIPLVEIRPLDQDDPGDLPQRDGV